MEPNTTNTPNTTPIPTTHDEAFKVFMQVYNYFMTPKSEREDDPEAPKPYMDLELLMCPTCGRMMDVSDFLHELFGCIINEPGAMKEVRENWDNILENVRTEQDISEVAVDTWLKPLRPYDIMNDRLYLVAADEAFAEYIMKYLRASLENAIAEVLGIRYEVRVIKR